MVTEFLKAQQQENFIMAGIFIFCVNKIRKLNIFLSYIFFNRKNEHAAYAEGRVCSKIQPHYRNYFITVKSV